MGGKNQRFPIELSEMSTSEMCAQSRISRRKRSGTTSTKTFWQEDCRLTGLSQILSRKMVGCVFCDSQLTSAQYLRTLCPKCGIVESTRSMSIEQIEAAIYRRTMSNCQHNIACAHERKVHAGSDQNLVFQFLMLLASFPGQSANC